MNPTTASAQVENDDSSPRLKCPGNKLSLHSDVPVYTMAVSKIGGRLSRVANSPRIISSVVVQPDTLVVVLLEASLAAGGLRVLLGASLVEPAAAVEAPVLDPPPQVLQHAGREPEHA